MTKAAHKRVSVVQKLIKSWVESYKELKFIQVKEFDSSISALRYPCNWNVFEHETKNTVRVRS